MGPLPFPPPNSTRKRNPAAVPFKPETLVDKPPLGQKTRLLVYLTESDLKYSTMDLDREGLLVDNN